MAERNARKFVASLKLDNFHYERDVDQQCYDICKEMIQYDKQIALVENVIRKAESIGFTDALAQIARDELKERVELELVLVTLDRKISGIMKAIKKIIEPSSDNPNSETLDEYFERMGVSLDTDTTVDGNQNRHLHIVKE